MNASQPNRSERIVRARYKLRQAETILAYLRGVPAEIAREMRGARTPSIPDVRLDALFFSCLGLAKSAYNILENDRPTKDAIHSWRMNVLDHSGRTQFNRMMNLRDIDVHQGTFVGETLGAMIPIEPDVDAWMYQQHPNNAALGIRPVATEHTNPDGGTASSFDGLQGTMQLYIEIAGKKVEASGACETFISQLRSLIDAVESANIPPLRVLRRLSLWILATMSR